MSRVAESFIRMFIMSLTEYSVLFDHLEQCDLATIGKVTFMIYMLLVTMLLINMLIAMMTNTYTEVSASSLEWLRQWSAIVLLMEQSFDPETRMKYQRHYSIPMEDGKRIALLLKLRTTVSDETFSHLPASKRLLNRGEEQSHNNVEKCKINYKILFHTKMFKIFSRQFSKNAPKSMFCH